MKKYELNLAAYSVTVPKIVQNEDGSAKVENGCVVMKDVAVAYPLRDNFATWLRSIGIFNNANDVVEAVTLAKAIRDCKDDVIQLDEREANIMKTMIDKLVALTAENKANVGGELHEEAIIRIMTMKEIED